MNVLRYSLPRRIVCLTEETTETLYALGAEDYIVGISGFTVRPAIARKTKPKISTYTEANLEKIIQLQPDIVLAWSDLQAPICQELIRAGVEVLCFNHRSIEGILNMIFRLGALVGKNREAERYLEQLMENIYDAEQRALKRKKRPKVYFEEWYDPLISGICWVSELIELCGGEDVFAENRVFQDAKRRIIANPDEVIVRQPDIMIASWCGKMFKPERVQNRVGWHTIPAVRDKRMVEIHSSVILQPGPAALTDGMKQILHIIDNWEHEQ